MRFSYPLAVAVFCVLLTACGPVDVPRSNELAVTQHVACHEINGRADHACNPSIQIVAPSNHVTGTYHASCRRTPSQDVRLPVPSCTPGAVRGDLVNPSQATLNATVCHPNWTHTVRPPTSETDKIRILAMAAYGEPSSDQPIVELDHLVPLSLGGASDVTNLWPEISDLPHARFNNSKDGVEDRLHAAVCQNRIAIADAQNAIATNWTTAEHTLRLK